MGIDRQFDLQFHSLTDMYEDASDIMLDAKSWQANASTLARAYAKRGDAFKETWHMLEDPPLEKITISEVEADAIKALYAKKGAKDAFSSAMDVLAPVGGLFGGLGGFLNESAASAEAGRALIEKGGEEAQLMLVAKKVAREVAGIDRLLVTKQIAAVKELYMEAAVELSETKGEGGELPVEDYSDKETAYMKRRKLYMEIGKMLGQPVPAPALKAAEGDAIAVMIAQDQYSFFTNALGSTFKLKGVTKHGALRKRGPTAAFKWDERWCVLQASSLCYYVDSTQREMKGDCAFSALTKVYGFKEEAAVGEATKYYKEKPYGFVMDPNPEAGKNRKLYYFDAMTPIVQKGWLDAIRKAVQKLEA